MTRSLCLLLVAVLASCATAPPPPPVEMPAPLPAAAELPVPAPLPALAPAEPPPAPPIKLPELHKAYAADTERLKAYLAQPRCLPSGQVECVDASQAAIAHDAQRQARSAIEAADRARAALQLARNRVEAFRAIVRDLPITD